MLAAHGSDGNGRKVLFRNHGGTKIALSGRRWIFKLMKTTW
jgi:hypothetical protein